MFINYCQCLRFLGKKACKSTSIFSRRKILGRKNAGAFVKYY